MGQAISIAVLYVNELIIASNTKSWMKSILHFIKKEFIDQNIGKFTLLHGCESEAQSQR
jgi:hypothetical protein